MPPPHRTSGDHPVCVPLTRYHRSGGGGGGVYQECFLLEICLDFLPTSFLLLLAVAEAAAAAAAVAFKCAVRTSYEGGWGPNFTGPPPDRWCLQPAVWRRVAGDSGFRQLNLGGGRQLNYLKLAVAVIRLNGKTVAVFAGFLGFLCIIVRGLNLAWFFQLVLVSEMLMHQSQ